jgi:hypothetical protein
MNYFTKGPMEAAARVAVILFFGFASFCSSAMISNLLVQLSA